MYKRTKKAIRMVVFSILAGGVMYSSLNAAQDSSLVAWWRLNEGSGTTANDSCAGNDGTLHGGAIWTAGIDWGGVYLDSIDDYIEIPNVLTKSAGIRRITGCSMPVLKEPTFSSPRGPTIIRPLMRTILVFILKTTRIISTIISSSIPRVSSLQMHGSILPSRGNLAVVLQLYTSTANKS